MAAVCRPIEVSTPAVTPYRYGLFSVATFASLPADSRWEECGIAYQPEACPPAKLLEIDCEEPPEKEASPPGCPAYGTPFLVYNAVDCDFVGSSFEEQRQRARRGLELGEQRAVEEAFWSGEYGNFPSLAGPCIDCGDDSAGESPGDCCVVLNTIPGEEGALSITGGLAALEEYAGNNYSGTPVLHAPRGLAAVAANANLLCVCDDSGRRESPLGTPWAFYGGSPNTGPHGEPAPAGTAWMYITGAITIRRSEIITNPPTAAEALNRRDNSTFVLAERIYALTTECICAAVLVKASDCVC